MALSMGERVNPEGGSSTSEDDEGCAEGAEVACIGAGEEERFVGGGGAFAPGSGCSTRAPAGASSLDTQEAKLARAPHAAIPTKRILERIRLICVLISICMPG
jgi:hypothetical protein